MGSVWNTFGCPDGVWHTFGTTSYFGTFRNPVSGRFTYAWQELIFHRGEKCAGMYMAMQGYFNFLDFNNDGKEERVVPPADV